MTDPRKGMKTTSPGHRLPVELVEHICILAAEADRGCAHQMAFVSRSICRLTALARWRVIAITSYDQFIALYRILQAVPCGTFDNAVEAFNFARVSYTSHASEEGERECSYPPGKALASMLEMMRPACSKEVRIQRRGSTVSLPSSGEPHEFIRHLYIDLPHPEDTISAKDVNSDWKVSLSTGWRKGMKDSQEFISNYLNDTVHRDPSMMDYWAAGSRARLLQGLEGLTLDHLSVGDLENSLLNTVDGNVTRIREMTAVTKSSDDCSYGKLRSLERLHLIGIDPDSRTSGMSPPWAHLDLATRGASLHRLTHLRYDTRKFSFKPAEIFATRLRVMLQEYTVEPQSGFTAKNEAEDTYRHTGPRHAAPSRNAGYRHQHGSILSSLIPVHHMRGDARADFLREEMGIGRLDFLQFAWDPMSTSEKREEDVPPHQRARYSALDQKDEASQAALDTGGWPRERRGAWTERSDRDVAPSFGVELRDAINALYGWHTPGIETAGKFVAHKETLPMEEWKLAKNVAFSPDYAVEMSSRIKNGFKEEDRLHLSEMQDKLSREMTRQGLDVSCKLQYGIRAPQSLVHLGGKVPFEPMDRLALFEDRARGGKGAWP